MHDQSVRRRAGQSLPRQSVARQIFPGSVAEVFLQPLALNAQHHHHVGSLDCFVDRKDGKIVRHQRFRSGQTDFGAKSRQELRVQPGNPAVPYVSADGDFQPLDPTKAHLQRERVEESLRRMLIRPVARVDDRAVDDVRDNGGSAIPLVTDDQQVRTHRVQGPRRVLQRLPLLDRGLFHRKGQDIRAEPVARRREGHERAGGILVKEVENQLAFELLARAARAVLREMTHSVVENARDLVVGEGIDRNQVHERLA